MKIISIDWDFFVEENPYLDLGHHEDMVFLGMVWGIREADWLRHELTTADVLPFRGPEPWSFPRQVLSLHSGLYANANAESHAAIVKWLATSADQAYEIYNFDAHHDVFYHSPEADMNLINGQYDCSNWGAHLMLLKKVCCWTQIYPMWRKKWPEGKLDEVTAWAEQLGVRFNVRYGLEHFRRVKADAVFICRSGCWVPPVYDSKFTDLCKAFGHTKFLKERKNL